MSSYDQWLEFQGGCYAQRPTCFKCGYELCEHGNCLYCAGCVLCEAEEETTKKPVAAVAERARHRKAV